MFVLTNASLWENISMDVGPPEGKENPDAANFFPMTSPAMQMANVTVEMMRAQTRAIRNSYSAMGCGDCQRKYDLLVRVLRHSGNVV